MAERKKTPEHITRLIDNFGEIYIQINKIDKDYPETSIFSKSALVLLIACWEDYIKALATNAFNQLLELSNSPVVFSKEVLLLVLKQLKSKDKAKLWDLNGNGWKTIFKEHRIIIDKYIKNFHGPKYDKVEKLFKEFIGGINLVKYWKFKDMQREDIEIYLDELIDNRNIIAHKLDSKELDKVDKEYIKKAISFIRCLADISSNALRHSISKRTNSNQDDVWGEVTLINC